MSEIATKTTTNMPALASRDALLSGINQTVAAIPATGGADYLKLTKAGEWLYGAEETEAHPKSVWAINPHETEKGYVSWGEGEKLGERTVRVFEPDVNPADLPDTGASWDMQLGLSMVCVSGSDEGAVVKYSTTSKGGLRAIQDVLNKMAIRLSEGSDEFVPLVTLDSSSYRHKKYGKIATPLLEIVQWNALDSTDRPDADPEPEEEPAPPKRTRTRRNVE